MSAGSVQSDIGDAAFTADAAACLGIAAQESGIAARIDVIGVVHRRQVVALVILFARKFAEIGGHGLEVEDLDRAPVALLAQAVPNMVERHPVHLVAVSAEGVDVVVAQLAPVPELNA